MAQVDGTSALKGDRRSTLEECRSWPEGERWELIDRVAYAMSPSPRVPHQDTVLDLAYGLREFLEGKPCRVFIAPLDVFLEEDAAEGMVVEPDVLVVCDGNKIRDDGIHGPPDFVAEVLSEGTAAKDLGAKKELYERAGVKEYWIVHPDTRSVFRYVREDGRYAPVTEFRRGETAGSVVLSGFTWKA